MYLHRSVGNALMCLLPRMGMRHNYCSAEKREHKDSKSSFRGFLNISVHALEQVPEFRIYWQDLRGDACNWNRCWNRFVQM